MLTDKKTKKIYVFMNCYETVTHEQLRILKKKYKWTITWITPRTKNKIKELIKKNISFSSLLNTLHGQSYWFVISYNNSSDILKLKEFLETEKNWLFLTGIIKDPVVRNINMIDLQRIFKYSSHEGILGQIRGSLVKNMTLNYLWTIKKLSAYIDIKKNAE